MKTKPQLILDIGGVLATNLTWFWVQFALESHTDYDQLRAHYKQEISDKLWTGKITEEYFWQWLINNYPSVNTARAKQLLQSAFKPLPAISLLPSWSQQADIHIISNHRAEWAKKLLKNHESHLKSITISSETGFQKPQLAIFKQVESLINKGDTILFVDDDKKNIEQAASLGWLTIRADTNGTWIDKVNLLLKNSERADSYGFSR